MDGTITTLEAPRRGFTSFLWVTSLRFPLTKPFLWRSHDGSPLVLTKRVLTGNSASTKVVNQINELAMGHGFMAY